MPFKSQAQRRKFAALLVQGKIAPETFEEWNRETGGQKLPERVKRKSKAKAARSTPRATKSKAKTAKSTPKAAKSKAKTARKPAGKNSRTR
jgi:hypothetical protein